MPENLPQAICNGRGGKGGEYRGGNHLRGPPNLVGTGNGMSKFTLFEGGGEGSLHPPHFIPLGSTPVIAMPLT